MFASITVSQRLLFAFGSATLMCAAIAALSIVQMQSLAAALGTPEALAASRRSALLVGTLAAVASAGGVVVSLWIVRGLAAALGAEPRVLGACARRVADGDLGGIAPPGARGVMADLARMQAQLVALVGAVRTEAEAVHTRGREIAQDSRVQEQQSGAQARELAAAATELQREAAAVQQGAHATQRAATEAGEARRAAHEAQGVMAAAVQRMQQVDEGARRIHDAALLIHRLAGQTGVLALNAAAAASRAGSAGAEFAVVAREVRALSERCTVAAGEVQQHIDAAVAQIHDGRTRVEQAGAGLDRIVAAAARVAQALATEAEQSQARALALGELGTAMARLDAQTREGAGRLQRSGLAAHALGQRSAQLVQAVAAFRVAGASGASGASGAPGSPGSAGSPAAAAAPAAMLATDGPQPRHAPDRRAFQPRRG